MTTGCQQEHPLILFKTSAIHGTGGFARVDIRRGKRIIEYLGPKIGKEEAQLELQKFNVFIFTLNSQYDIDGSVEWNMARFINHSCQPNCEVDIKRGRIWVMTRRDVKAGEELTYNYSYDMEDYEERPCHCGAARCVGYMVGEAHFAALRQRQRSR